MRKKSTYIVLILILIIFFVVMFFFFGMENVKQGNYSATFLVGNNTVWSYSERKWSHLSALSDYQKLNWQEYTVFIDNQKVGNYFLWHDDKWYLFQKNKTAVPYSGNLLAYSANYDVSVAPFELQEITDTTYIFSVMEKYGISTDSEFTSSSVISFDFDKDGASEDFYLITNAFPFGFVPESLFSFVFMVKDGEIYPIYTDVSTNQAFRGCKPFFTSFLDTNADGMYEFILSCGRYSVMEQIDMLYQFKDNEFKIVVSNQ